MRSRFITTFLFVAHAVQNTANDCTTAENDWSFKYNDQRGRGCAWVESEKSERCHFPGVRGNCAKTCCDIATLAPGADHSCISMLDNYDFKYNGQVGRGCGWVSKKSSERCLLTGAEENCKRSCCEIMPSSSPSSMPSTSGEPSDFPSEVPSVSPSDIPSGEPSDFPTIDLSCVGVIDDWDFKYLGEWGRGCAWVNKKPWERCHFQGVKESCMLSCCYIMPYPSGIPTGMPSPHPSISTSPSSMPSVGPSTKPSGSPSAKPSTIPSAMPSPKPSASSAPSGSPSSVPSTIPSDMPSISTIPSAIPSTSTIPSNIPSTIPSYRPTWGKGKGKGGEKREKYTKARNTRKTRVANMQLP